MLDQAHQGNQLYNPGVILHRVEFSRTYLTTRLYAEVGSGSTFNERDRRRMERVRDRVQLVAPASDFASLPKRMCGLCGNKSAVM